MLSTGMVYISFQTINPPQGEEHVIWKIDPRKNIKQQSEGYLKRTVFTCRFRVNQYLSIP